MSLISVSIVGLRLGLYGFARSAREGLETSGWDVDADRARLSTIVGKDALLSIGGVPYTASFRAATLYEPSAYGNGPWP